ncbi:MAG TPA: glycosyl hydrolase family protein [Candidatus Poseidoniales archaeon]|nr:family 1 glycosylhydrolase [Candidatus Poseidoniaceae archaeon]DAC44742.1 MAG TPA: glycosyl hydrolase family protein [Candidatus Poseidoniales archaeon]HII22197.1 family 1 glycosylhydrolase [Candidatus Poseidoniaceae archaeon]
MWSEEHRDWTKVNYKPLTEGTAFPSEFMWGVATASHQIEGGNTNNWSAFEPRSKSQQLSGEACDHWHRRTDDVGLIKDLGVSHYRFSIEWSRIVPAEGDWNQEAAQWYSDLVDELLAEGIQPMATLHHFTQPMWWEEQGGFEREENIHHWVDFSTRMFALLSDRVEWWCTINEPAVFTTMGYVLGEFPPGVRSFKRARSVAMNMMKAHAACYRALKAMEHGPKCEIGLVKNINLFDPYRRWNPLHWFQARLLDSMFNRCWIKGLKTGRFKPPSALTSTTIPGLKGSSDFIGVNYYTHLLTTPFMPTKVEIDPLIRPWEQRTDFRYPMYAEGLRRAFEMVKGLNIPIIVTENGVADDDDDMRPEHIRRHLQITAEAIADGFDIRGFYHWSLMDNFEWAEGYDQRFGLYHVDFETKQRTLKESGNLYASIVKSHRRPQVVIMAGGLGTRLGEVTETIPKSLVEVNGKPILTHILDWAHKQGCLHALVLTGHLGEQFEGFRHPRMAVKFHREASPLGTGGALWNARALLEDRFILLWGDDLHPIDYTELINTHNEAKAPLTMCVTQAHAEMNLKHAKGILESYDKKQEQLDLNGYEAGTSIVEKSVVLEHGKDGVWSWEETVYSALAGKAAIHLDNTPFWDMGTPERLALLERFLKETAP